MENCFICHVFYCDCFVKRICDDKDFKLTIIWLKNKYKKKTKKWGTAH